MLFRSLRAHSVPGFTPRILGEPEMAEVYAKIGGSYGTTGRPRAASTSNPADPRRSRGDRPASSS